MHATSTSHSHSQSAADAVDRRASGKRHARSTTSRGVWLDEPRLCHVLSFLEARGHAALARVSRATHRAALLPASSPRVVAWQGTGPTECALPTAAANRLAPARLDISGAPKASAPAVTAEPRRALMRAADTGPGAAQTLAAALASAAMCASIQLLVVRGKWCSALGDLTPLRALRELRVRGTCVVLSKSLRLPPSLTTLDTGRCVVLPISHLPLGLTNLQHLGGVFMRRVADEADDAALVAASTALLAYPLTSLTVMGIDERCLAPLASGLTRLHTLVLHLFDHADDPRLDADLAWPSRGAWLEEQHSRLGNVAALAQCAHLRRLCVSSSCCEAAQAHSFSTLTQLTHLALTMDFDQELAPKDVERMLAPLRSLVSLGLCAIGATDAHLGALVRLPCASGLTSINLDGNPIESATALARLPALSTLRLAGTRIARLDRLVRPPASPHLCYIDQTPLAEAARLDAGLGRALLAAHPAAWHDSRNDWCDGES